MSTSLQQVVQKSKVSTLDGDLKAIAEQMLRDKFGFEEEVVTERGDRFQELTIDIDPAFLKPAHIHHTGPDYGRGNTDFDPRTGERIVRQPILSRHSEPLGDISNAMRELDEKGLPNANRIIYLSHGRFAHIMRESLYVVQSPHYVNPMLWGAALIPAPCHEGEWIEQRY